MSSEPGFTHKPPDLTDDKLCWAEQLQSAVSPSLLVPSVLFPILRLTAAIKNKKNKPFLLTWTWPPHSSSAPGLSSYSALSPAPAAESPHWSLPAASSAPPLDDTTQTTAIIISNFCFATQPKELRMHFLGHGKASDTCARKQVKVSVVKASMCSGWKDLQFNLQRFIN